MLTALASKISHMERKIDVLVEAMKKSPISGPADVEAAVKEEIFTPSGINITRLPSRDAYSYGLQLLDIFFTKEELASSLLFKSKKSSKKGLDPEKVAKLISYIEKRYDSWDLKVFIAKANQKCRDSAVKLL